MNVINKIEEICLKKFWIIIRVSYNNIEPEGEPSKIFNEVFKESTDTKFFEVIDNLRDLRKKNYGNNKRNSIGSRKNSEGKSIFLYWSLILMHYN